MIGFIKNYWFFIGIGAMVILAFSAPSLGLFVRQHHILEAGIFVAFFITGMTLDTSDVARQFGRVKVLLAALISSLLLFPVAVYFAAHVFFATHSDFIVGALIIAAAPVTIASGTVMTGVAKGNISLSLFICVLSNIAAIFSIPPLLNVLIGTTVSIDLPVREMITGLIVTILIPTTAGQALQPKVRRFTQAHAKNISVFNQCIVLLIIFNAVAGSTARLIDSASSIVEVFLFMAVIHAGFLFFNYRLAKFIKLDPPSVSAFTIHTSQKTLTVSYLVWAGYLADSFPTALIPCIAYHLTQSVCDTILAAKLGRQAEAAAYRTKPLETAG
ncbi:bile acid:sodium symporter [Desulforhopalus singaporensis]|uniref:Predicted Na+-dependent transporter n=1 Tax=Desulforhopalus singaporensis TaxID=91360 RepID=A0A1H0RLQ7_9BACT|nr:bile acid:sodium symporter [Desulforhopalus singaporensis]SDP30239.1 Predicted Na+-dependent transporter [Desulforhopalus singaporensis]